MSKNNSPYSWPIRVAIHLPAIFAAIIIAIVIRQTVAEFFEIPSGSMRPTFMESDRLLVSKTQFGLNVPFVDSHIIFHPDEIQRMGIVIFTGNGVDMYDTMTRYFGIIPARKHFIKRVIGLPGDQLYFYGGNIYGIDKNGNDISHELQPAFLEHINHVPFISIEGKVISEKTDEGQDKITFKQSGVEIAQCQYNEAGEVVGKILLPIEEDIYKLWGMEHFGHARLLSHTDANKQEGYYLEIIHHASAHHAVLKMDHHFCKRPSLQTYKVIIPLTEEHLHKLWDALYTCRFTAENGYLYQHSIDKSSFRQFAPKIKRMRTNGTFEFIDGQAYEITRQGMKHTLNADHPLANFDAHKLYILFNTGMECDNRFVPNSLMMGLFSSRYAYFKNNDLYVMGAKLMDANDETLKCHVETELCMSKADPTYPPFIDMGPPMIEGHLDIEKIKMYGYKVPVGKYLVLGDNYAMSGDSRNFGCVPAENIKGIPSFIIWGPGGGRLGSPNNGIYHSFTLPRMIAYVAIGVAIWIYKVSRKKLYS